MPLRPTTLASPLGRDTGARPFFLGVVLILVAFTAPLPSSAVTVTMICGVATTLLAVAAPWISELEIGPSGFKTRLREVDGPAPILLEAKVESLSEFALLVSGDALQARELVEKAMVKAASHPRQDRAAFALHRLIDLLESAADRRWLQTRGSSGAAEAPSGPITQRVIDHLQQVAFFPRVCFLLHANLELTPAEVARVLEQPVDQVVAAIEEARKATLPNDRETRHG